MKALLVTGEYPPMRGGVADYTAYLAAGLRRQGVEPLVLTSTRARAAGPSGIPSAAPPASHYTSTWGFPMWRRTVDVIRATTPDVVHVQYQAGAYDLHVAVNLLPLRLRAIRGRPRVVVTFHDLKFPYILPKAGPLRPLSVRLLARSADAVIVTNAEDASELAGGQASDGNYPDRLRPFGPAFHRIPIGSNIMSRPPHGYNRALWRQRMGVAPDELLLSYFGFLGHSKGVDLLLEALTGLRDSGANVKLVMVGGASGDNNLSDRGYEARIRQMADQPRLRGCVIWTGFTEADNVSANLLASDACVLPFREGPSLRHGTLIAAIVHGLPIISTTPRPLPPLQPGLQLVAGETALLTEHGSAPRLAEAIRELYASPELRARLAAGSTRLSAAFGWDAIAEQTIGVYRAITG